MSQFASPKNEKTTKAELLGSHLKVTLLNDRQWMFIRERYRISPRELQVAKLTCQGLTDKEVARVLKIRHGTVKVHLRNIYRRVQVKSKIALLLRFVGDANHLFDRSAAGRINLGFPPSR